MKQATCKERINEYWKSTQADWKEHQKDTTYLNEQFILGVDYVEPNTFTNQKKGYKRIQFSWGGPSDELRVFSNGTVEYWFMDWFDGAKLDVTSNKIAQEISDYYQIN